jgi:HEAT repeat protein
VDRAERKGTGLDKEAGTQKLAFLIILLLTGAGALAWAYWPESPRAKPEELAQQALSGDNPIVQQRAATQLSGYRHAEAAPPLRQVLKEARHPDVRAAAAQALGDVQDFQSVPELLRLCDDPSPLVRGRAGSAVTNIIGMDSSRPTIRPKSAKR